MACNTCKSTNSCSCGKSTTKVVIDCNGKHITELPSLLTPADGDLIYIYDASTGESRSWSLEELVAYLSTVIEVTPPLIGTLTPGIFGDSESTAVVEVSPDGVIVNVSETPIELEIEDLTNVDTTGALVGDVLQWNGADWVPYTIPTYVPITSVDTLYLQQSSSAGVSPLAIISDPAVISTTFNLELTGSPGDLWEIDIRVYYSYAPQVSGINYYMGASYNTNPAIVAADVTDVAIPSSYFYNILLNQEVAAANAYGQAQCKWIHTQSVSNELIKPKFAFTSGVNPNVKIYNRIITAHKIS